jgi:hypothetical protein
VPVLVHPTLDVTVVRGRGGVVDEQRWNLCKTGPNGTTPHCCSGPTWYFPNILYFLKERYSKCPVKAGVVLLLLLFVFAP